MFIILAIGLIAIIGMSYLSNRNQRKRQQEMQDTLRAIKPGNHVKTIGGICGTVVEVCPEENTFVLETGNEANGKSYIKFDMVAIYQTDAKKEEAPAELAEDFTDAPVEEAPIEEAPVEEAPVEETVVEEDAE